VLESIMIMLHIVQVKFEHDLSTMC